MRTRSPALLSSSRWKGSLWKVVASLSFALSSVLVRFLSKGTETFLALPVNQILFLENLFGLLLISPLIVSLGWKNLKTHDIFVHSLRVLCACGGIVCWYTSLKYMQIGYASALAFMGPIFTVLGGFILLKERLTPLKNIAILISFIGAYLIIRPDMAFTHSKSGLLNEVGFYAVLPLLSALCIAGSKLITRKLASTGHSSQVLTVYLMLGLVPTTILPAVLSWVDMSLQHLILCALLGTLVILAHYSTSQAYRYAGINFLTPISFLKLITGIILGYIVFSEIPTQLSVWSGMGVILFSIFLLTLGREKDAKQA